MCLQLFIASIKAGRTPTNPRLLDISLPSYDQLLARTSNPSFVADYALLVSSLADQTWIAQAWHLERLIAVGYAMVASGR